MNTFENPNTGAPSPQEELESEVEVEEEVSEEDFLAAYLAETEPELPEAKEVCAPFVEKFKEDISILLEEEHLSMLNAITKEIDAISSPERMFACAALDDLCKQLNFMEKQTDIPEDEFAEILGMYKLLSNAVGLIEDDGKVHHDR